MSEQLLKIHDTAKDIARILSHEGQDEVITLEIDLLLTRIKNYELMSYKKMDILRSAIKDGNKLFDFFSDVYINEACTRDVSVEISRLNDYLQSVTRKGIAPVSSAMTTIVDDNIFKGLF